MKYILVFNLVVFNLKYTKIKKGCVFTCVYEGGGGGGGGGGVCARNPSGSQGGSSLEKFGNHWCT